MKRFLLSVILFTLPSFVYSMGEVPALDSFEPISLQQDEGASFSYTSIGVGLPFPIPGISFGHREKFQGNAVDYSVGLASIVIASGISASCQYIHYINENNYYFGAGGGVGLGFVAYVPAVYGASPTFGFGKEGEKRFHQVNVAPIHFSTAGLSVVPTVTYQYGIKF